MATLIAEYWFFAVAAVGGIIASVVMFGPSIAARARKRVPRRAYLPRVAYIALFAGIIVGVIAFPFAQPESVPFVLAAFVVAAACIGGLLTLQRNAVHISRAFGLWTTVELDADRMAAPVEHSWLLTALFVVVGLMGGFCGRLFIEASA